VALPSGHGRYAAPSQCETCYTRARRNPTWLTIPAKTPGWLVLAEYEHFARPGLSQAQNCALVAQELGMTPTAVERALVRRNARERMQA